MIDLLCVTTYTGMGGGETSLLTLMAQLDPARFRPHLLTPSDGQLGERFRSHGWQTHAMPWRGATVYFLPDLYARFPIVGRMARLIERENIRLIHSDYHSLPFAAAAARLTKTPLVWTCWGWWFQPKPWQRGFFRRLSAPPYHTFAASAAIRLGYLGNPPFMPPERVEVLPPGVDTARFHPGVDGSGVRAEIGIAPETPLVALIARFQDVKGHDTFQDMARHVLDAMPEARFIVAGENVHGVSADDAYKRRILDAWRADSRLSAAITYLGFRADAERVIAAADVVVCPSRFESYGMVNVEAMACAKPVVSTNAGGPAETVVDSETGYLVAPDHPAALAERVLRLLRDPDLRQRMGDAGRARVERLFSASAMAARFMARAEALVTR
jgi:glycosyltransferase involved in cell wall biosynthesis